MANTTSLNWPNMFNVAQNEVAVLSDTEAIVKRVKLLLLTDPTELYNSPEFGVGLKKYLFTYNTENTKAIIRDRIKEKLRQWEPCVDADKTRFTDGLLYTGNDSELTEQSKINELDLTISLMTIFGDNAEVTINE